MRHFAKTVSIWMLCLVAMCIAPLAGKADAPTLGTAAVAPNIMDFRVSQEGVLVKLEIFPADLEAFSDIIPNAWLKNGGASVAPESERLVRFSTEGLSIRTDQGDTLPVKRIGIAPRQRIDRTEGRLYTIDPVTGQELPNPPADPRVFYAELLYEFTNGLPDGLTISAPPDMRSAAGMVFYHDAVPVIDFRYLSGPARVALDWDDPWFSKFDNPNLRRHHNWPRMSFLYAEPHEVRYEVLVRVRDAIELTDTEVSGPTIDEAAAATLTAELSDWLLKNSPMTVDGEPVLPDFDRSAYMRIGLRGLEFLQPGDPINVDAGIIGLIWSVPVDGLPQSASVEWTWFDGLRDVMVGYAVDASGPFLFPLTADEPRVDWVNNFKFPPYPPVEAVAVTAIPRPASLLVGLGSIAAISLLYIAIVFLRPALRSRAAVIGAGLATLTSAGGLVYLEVSRTASTPDLDPVQLNKLTGDLLDNVYRAFDFRTEDQVYERLALTLEGDVLEQVYLAQRDALRIERAGGADARVSSLDVRSVTVLPPGTDGFSLKADWTVTGQVGHWGHVHSRSNAYVAEMAIQPVEGTWKIVAFDVLIQERLR